MTNSGRFAFTLIVDPQERDATADDVTTAMMQKRKLLVLDSEERRVSELPCSMCQRAAAVDEDKVLVSLHPFSDEPSGALLRFDLARQNKASRLNVDLTDDWVSRIRIRGASGGRWALASTFDVELDRESFFVVDSNAHAIKIDGSLPTTSPFASSQPINRIVSVLAASGLSEEPPAFFAVAEYRTDDGCSGYPDFFYIYDGKVIDVSDKEFLLDGIAIATPQIDRFDKPIVNGVLFDCTNESGSGVAQSWIRAGKKWQATPAPQVRTIQLNSSYALLSRGNLALNSQLVLQYGGEQHLVATGYQYAFWRSPFHFAKPVQADMCKVFDEFCVPEGSTQLPSSSCPRQMTACNIKDVDLDGDKQDEQLRILVATRLNGSRFLIVEANSSIYGFRQFTSEILSDRSDVGYLGNYDVNGDGAQDVFVKLSGDDRSSNVQVLTLKSGDLRPVPGIPEDGLLLDSSSTAMAGFICSFDPSTKLPTLTVFGLGTSDPQAELFSGTETNYMANEKGRMVTEGPREKTYLLGTEPIRKAGITCGDLPEFP
ncbi:hypothetical protein [Actinokineospora bangkokensis]|uniref:hypothetical protein n=1 Tax=Actinokineospora bangkokensis TaxID=1193682 RepID=UPI001178387D|nr:hypothetical protein [Actinokineospora bangkokensis]